MKCDCLSKATAEVPVGKKGSDKTETVKITFSGLALGLEKTATGFKSVVRLTLPLEWTTSDGRRKTSKFIARHCPMCGGAL